MTAEFLSPASLARLPKATLIDFVITLAQRPSVDADVPAPTPTPEAQPEKAKREVPCKVHDVSVCTRKFWGDKGATDCRVARLA